MASLQAPRPWFGHLVLAPANAIHPVHDKSFDEIHRNIIAHSSPRGVLGMAAKRNFRLSSGQMIDML